MPEALLSLEHVSKTFRGRSTPFARGAVTQAVDDVTLDVAPGETVALVGESGSGKSTLSRIALRLTDPTSGTVRWDGLDVTRAHGRGLRTLRRELGVVFQDPYTSLNPRQTVARIVSAPLRNQGLPRDDETLDELMTSVGLSPEHLNRYPHQFSGGQRQRIGIARALATRPRMIIADEPVSALDVSIRAQILSLLDQLQQDRGLALLIVSHDLAVVRGIADRVAVMRAGRIVESGPVERVYADPQEDYTRALLAAIPVPDPHRRARPLPALGGD
ncbi:ABC transporter ATP-binding protein [Flexivirga sp. ID2601S]|uniref:ABC transporter ATP-binding protein n=1 Tax=Flexivirga aerilata TaxID=1656889 RepID=A0A849AEQ2_9MICO|nr:ATP-binding cassette domain-containing protein [Flexivirga aerilata]NNG38975.1 ABC transporter ATP-binding protein [Flexivirga aerilata]